MADAAVVDAPVDTGLATTPTGEPVSAPTPQVNWTDSIPSEYRADKVWEPLKGKDLGAVLKGYAEGQKLVGSSLRLPPKDATPADLAKWKTEHGPKLAGLFPSAPAKPEDYTFDRPEAALDLGWDEAAETHMRGIWHKAGMSNEQVAATIAGYAAWQQERLKAASGHVATTEAELKAEWGAEYTPRIGRAVRFMKETGAEFGIPDLMETTGLGNHASMIRWLAKVSQAQVEHGAMDSTPSVSMSEDEFSRRATEIRNEMAKVNSGSVRETELQNALESLYKNRRR